MEHSLKKKTAKNISYNAIAKISMFGLQALANVVLTRQLLATDYGLVGMALIFTNFFSQFGDFGLGNAVIRKKDLGDRELYTAFTMRVILGLGIVLMCVLVAPLAVTINHNDKIKNIIMVLSLLFIVYPFGFLSTIHLMRELRYDKLFFPQVGSVFVGSLAAIILAISGFGYWSMVLSTAISSLVSVAILNYIRPVKIKFCFDREHAKELFRFGINVFSAGMISYAILNADNFLIGVLNGSNSLGYYMIAFNWGSMVATLLTGIVSSVLLPTFAKMQGDRQRLSNAFLNVVELIIVCALFGNILLFLAGKEFLYYVLGHSTEKWFLSLKAMQILCLYGVLRSVQESCANIMMSMGHAQAPFRAALLAAVIELGLIYPAIKFGGIEGIALIVTIASASQFIVYLPFLDKHLGISCIQFMFKIKNAIISAVFTICSMALVIFYFISEISIPAFVTKVVLSSVIFILSYGLLSRWKLIYELKEVIRVKAN